MTERDENYMHDVVFGIHEYAGMPSGFDMPWDTSLIDLSDSVVYIICRFPEPSGIVRYDGYLVNPQWKRLEATNQAFVVPWDILVSKNKTDQTTLLTSLDFSVAMAGASAMQSLPTPTRAGGVWIGMTPFRGHHISNSIASRAYINLVDQIRGGIVHGVITVPESALDAEVCGDSLTRTPSSTEYERFWASLGLTPTRTYATTNIVG